MPPVPAAPRRASAIKRSVGSLLQKKLAAMVLDPIDKSIQLRKADVAGLAGKVPDPDAQPVKAVFKLRLRGGQPVIRDPSKAVEPAPTAVPRAAIHQRSSYASAFNS